MPVKNYVIIDMGSKSGEFLNEKNEFVPGAANAKRFTFAEGNIIIAGFNAVGAFIGSAGKSFIPVSMHKDCFDL